MIKNFTSTYKAHLKTSIFITLVLIGGLYFGYQKFFGTSTETRYVTTTVERGIMVSSVTGTGQVSTLDKVDLKPIGSGTLIEVDAQNGDKLYSGQVVAIMDQRNALISLKQARANLESAQANYNKVLTGATPADIEVSQASLQSASTTLANAKQNLIDKLNIAYITTSQSILNNTNNLFSNGNFDSAQLSVPNYNITNSQLGINLNNERVAINHLLSQWKNEIAGLTITSDLDGAVNTTSAHLSAVGQFFDDLQLLLTTGVAGDSRNQSTLDGYASSVTSARSSISSTNTGIISAKQTVMNAVSSLSQAQASYNLKVQSARPEDLASALASVHSSEANLQSAQNAYENNIIRAPFDGILANLSVHVGDWVSSGAASGSGSSIGSVLTKQEIALIPMNEVDVAKIKIGNKVTLTFDAIPDLMISGSVVDIDSLGTVTSGVVTYNVKLKFDTQDDRVKPGMSISASIVTDTKTDTLLVPNSAIKSKGGVQTVQIFDTALPEDTTGTGSLSPTLPKDQVVTVGISNDTSTEILTGLKEGDIVVTKINTTTAAKASSAPTLLQATGAGGRTSGSGTRATTGTTRTN
jgi:HlyD family secretion protein